jgi:predicted DNA-binding protein (UPF0251 family)
MKEMTIEMPTYLYRCFDPASVLLFAGITDDLDDALDHHSLEDYWWSDVTRITRTEFATFELAIWAKWAVVTTCDPLYNSTAVVPAQPLSMPCPEPAAARPKRRRRSEKDRLEAKTAEAIQLVNAGVYVRQAARAVGISRSRLQQAIADCAKQEAAQILSDVDVDSELQKLLT